MKKVLYVLINIILPFGIGVFLSKTFGLWSLEYWAIGVPAALLCAIISTIVEEKLEKYE